MAVLGGQRTSLAAANSLITGKIQAILVERPLPACTNQLKRETSWDEFPEIGTGNLLLQTGKDTALTAKLHVLVGTSRNVSTRAANDCF